MVEAQDQLRSVAVALAIPSLPGAVWVLAFVVCLPVRCSRAMASSCGNDLVFDFGLPQWFRQLNVRRDFWSSGFRPPAANDDRTYTGTIRRSTNNRNVQMTSTAGDPVRVEECATRDPIEK